MPQAESQIQPRRCVRGKADPRGVPQRNEAAVTHQKVKARREYRGNEDLAGEIDVKVSAEHRERRQHQAEENPDEPLHVLCLPNRPRGRKAITAIMGRNRITYARSGSSAEPKV